MKDDPLSQELTDQERLLLAFGYLGPLAIVTLVASRRELVRWHAKQGLVLSVSAVALYIVLKAIHLFLRHFLSSVFAELFWMSVGLLALGLVVVVVLCLTRGLEGERFKIPILGDLADRL